MVYLSIDIQLLKNFPLFLHFLIFLEEAKGECGCRVWRGDGSVYYARDFPKMLDGPKQLVHI
jgi:hypothetical protein